ncbi:MAG TPA: hypothetical protein PKE20_08625 [Promineifilum sp.]|nr:hypothetical protein [Promineifilum sp.]
MDDNIKGLKEKEREEAYGGKLEDKVAGENGHCGTWVPGLILIGIGAFFLLRNFTDFRLDNWWALFILIPAFGSFGNFARVYGREGALNGEARGSLIGGLILTFIAATFLFGWDWGVVWPIFLVIGGIGALLSGLLGN